MKRSLLYACIFLSLVVISAAVVFLLGLAGRVSASARLAAALPTYGWLVCEDLGIAPIPGGGQAQHMVMCKDGWRVQVYCLEPAKPAPPLNQPCSMVSLTDFWCGDQVQMFRELTLLETPVDTPTPTNTFIATNAFTPTNTPSASLTPTSNKTATATGTLSLTPWVLTNTPTALSTQARNQNVTRTPQPTPFNRPHAGGPGNSRLAASALALLLGGALFLLAAWLRRGHPFQD